MYIILMYTENFIRSEEGSCHILSFVSDIRYMELRKTEVCVNIYLTFIQNENGN